MVKWISRNLRVLTSVITVLLGLFGTIAVITIITNRFPGGIGLAIALIAGISMALGVLVVYWNLVDWLNFRIIRHQLGHGRPVLRDNKIVAFCGTVRQDGEPMTSPFSEKACAAYTYRVAISRSSSRSTGSGRSRRVLAQGFHMNRVRIEGTTHSVRLGSLPGFEDELRQDLHGGEWADNAKALMAKIAPTATNPGEKEQYARLLEARHSVAEEFHQDFMQNGEVGNGASLVVTEEILPVDQTVCVVGTYDDRFKGVTARRARLGPNLMVYLGSVNDVMERVGKDLIWFAKAAAILLAIGIVPLVIALLPAEWASKLPILGSLIA